MLTRPMPVLEELGLVPLVELWEEQSTNQRTERQAVPSF